MTPAARCVAVHEWRRKITWRFWRRRVQHAESFLSRKPPNDERVVELAITEAEACKQLRVAVEDAAARSAGSIKDLRFALHQFTVTFREAGTTPEAVLIRLRKVIDQRTFPGLPARAVDNLSPIIREQMSKWCIQDYFRDKPKLVPPMK